MRTMRSWNWFVSLNDKQRQQVRTLRPVLDVSNMMFTFPEALPMELPGEPKPAITVRAPHITERDHERNLHIVKERDEQEKTNPAELDILDDTLA